MSRTLQTDEMQIQRTYWQLTFLGFLLHTAQALIFYAFAFPIPFVYNCISAAFYAVTLCMVQRKMYRATVCTVHIESCMFAFVCTISCGWSTGIPLFLLAMSSLVYFCPFDHKFVPYAFSLAELLFFVALRVYSYYNEPLYGYLPRFWEMLYYLFNALACFYIILFAAYSSNISAMVSNIRLRSENRSLSIIANSDYLTGLPSRRAFLQRAKELSPDNTVIAAIGDLDDFKTINDNYGHSSGDYVLRTVGHLISECCGQHTIPCRWGGEEFVILFHSSSPSEALSLLQELRGRIAAYAFEHEEQAMKITITFGAYEGTIRDGVEHLIGEADEYLYKGKQSGKNCVCCPFS